VTRNVVAVVEGGVRLARVEEENDKLGDIVLERFIGGVDVRRAEEVCFQVKTTMAATSAYAM
jgi:hypothetical protein